MPDQLLVRRLVRELAEERDRPDEEKTEICKTCSTRKCGFEKCVNCLESELRKLWHID